MVNIYKNFVNEYVINWIYFKFKRSKKLSHENTKPANTTTTRRQQYQNDPNNPEWLDDDDGQENSEEKAMTFDETGNFIPVKDLKNNSKSASTESSQQKPTESEPKKEQAPQQQQQQQQSQSSSQTANLESKSSLDKLQALTSADNILLSNANKLSNLVQQQQQQQQIQQQKQSVIVSTNMTISNTLSTTSPTAMSALTANLLKDPVDDDSNILQQLKLFNLNSLATNSNDANVNSSSQHQQQQNQQQHLLGAQNLLQTNEFLTNLSNPDPKLGAVPLDHPDAERWFYLDPQNQIQGPFSSEQMTGWFVGGYFSSNLMIKRGLDEKFLPLAMFIKNWGPIPFMTATSQHHQQQQQQQVLQQLQMLQQMQQLQYFPQNFNLLRNELTQNINNISSNNLGLILQQLQQLQLQQKTINQLPANTMANMMQDMRNQQEALINQISVNTSNSKSLGSNIANNKIPSAGSTSNNQANAMHDQKIIDSAILGGASNSNSSTNTKTQSIWDIPGISPIGVGMGAKSNTTPPISTISPLDQNRLIQQQQQHSNTFASMVGSAQMSSAAMGAANQLPLSLQKSNDNNNNAMQILNENMMIKDKIQALFEQTKKEEEKRRKLEEDYKLRVSFYLRYWLVTYSFDRFA